MLKEKEISFIMYASGGNNFGSEYEFDDTDIEEERGDYDSEDTEDASETEIIEKEEEYTELKEQVYQDQMASLKKQLRQLEEGQHPEYNKGLKKIEAAYKERLFQNEVAQVYEIERVDRDYINEKLAAVREFDEKKIEIKENLILELEEKKKMIEIERTSMELAGEESEILEDLKALNKGKSLVKKSSGQDEHKLARLVMEGLVEGKKDRGRQRRVWGDDLKEWSKSTRSVDVYNHDTLSFEAKLEDGKLYYDKKCFQRGHPVIVEPKEYERFNGVISAMGATEDDFMQSINWHNSANILPN
ncbi:Sin3 histone deacetylase corepressor complex component SDS3 [Nymphon striatum]|nr:Sin3 histone deacetylase corepressor complex component SDS3 [Nymphon striatum]